MLNTLRQTYQRLLNDVQLKKRRYLFDKFNLANRLTGLVGPRGVGKTTLLLQYIKLMGIEKESFYFSADHFYFNSNNLYDFIEELYEVENIRHVFIDEIHKYKNWNQELKNISVNP